MIRQWLLSYILSIILCSSAGVLLPEKTKTVSAEFEQAKAVCVMEQESRRILYESRGDMRLPMASTTKIATAITVLDACEDITTEFSIPDEAVGVEGSSVYLQYGDVYSVEDLLYGLMLRSGNDAAVALAEYAGGDIKGFTELMNKKAYELGLTNTHFETPHGLDSDEHYTTAYELALLSNYALNNTTFAQIVGTKNYTITINGYPKDLSNTNELLGFLDGVYGIKTGFTNGANRCLVSACKRNDMDIICVVLGADTKSLRTSDSIKLINYIFDNFKPVNIKEIINSKFEEWKNENLDKIIINKGITQNICLEIENIDKPIIPIRKDLIDSINVSINYSTFFEAPLLERTVLGNIHVAISENLIFDYNIYNSYEIKRKSWSTYIFKILKNYPNILEKNLI